MDCCNECKTTHIDSEGSGPGATRFVCNCNRSCTCHHMDLPVQYIPGDTLAFKLFIHEQGVGKNANLKAIEGKFRWVITRKDGREYIARPEEAKIT